MNDLTNILENAEKESRKHPATENHCKWLAEWKMIDAVGAELPLNFAPLYSPLFNKPYMVVRGDTLSKIA